MINRRPSKIVAFDAFMAGATKFEWTCIDCPRLYVMEFYAVRHAVTTGHRIASRTEIEWPEDVTAPHSFVGCLRDPPDAPRGSPRNRQVICCFCGRPEVNKIHVDGNTAAEPAG